MMDSNMDASKIQSIFPEEIWLLIAEQVQDTRDYQRLCDSSPYFRNLLLRLRVAKLFPDVAKVFCSQIQRNAEMKRQAITKFRTVCRTWAKWTDVALHNLPYELLPDETSEFNENPGPRNLLLTKDYFRRIGQIESFRQHFDGTHASTNRNPFLCRKVNMLYGHSVPNELLIEQLFRVLRVYGPQIWHCSLSVFYWERHRNAMLHYEKLWEMLKLMPNLQTLSLTGRSLGRSVATFEQLELYVSAHPFPKLEHLRYLKMYEVPPPIFDGLLNANPHISICNAKLEFLENYPNEPALFMKGFQNLNQLSIELNKLVQLQQFQNCRFAWPLRKLLVKVTQEIPCNDFIKVLGNKLPNTLTDLTLVFRESEQLLELVPLQLPCLEMFSLKTIHPTPLDFLLPTKNTLKRLSVKVFDQHENINLFSFQAGLRLAWQAENTVKLLRFRRNLIESNIWTIFPQLRSVEYYDREVEYFPKLTRPPIRRFDLMLKKLADIH